MGYLNQSNFYTVLHFLSLNVHSRIYISLNHCRHFVKPDVARYLFY